MWHRHAGPGVTSGLKVDIHTHILPENWPDLKERYGYGGFIQLEHHGPGCARMVLDGFFDRYTELKIIAAHGGGYLPYVSGRIDMFFDQDTLVAKKIDRHPSTYLENIWYDSIVYDPGALALCLEICGPEKVMFGTDLPMPADVDRRGHG